MSELDTDIRDAFQALDRTAPEGDSEAYFASYFDSFASRVDARLEAAAMTDPDREPAGAEAPRAEHGDRRADAELDDIRADIQTMARDTRRRVSHQQRAATDAENSLLLSASSSGLRAVVLPDPSVDDWNFDDDDLAARRAGSAPGKDRGGEDEDDDERSGLPVWIYAAVGAVALAAVVFFLVRGGADQHDPASGPLARGAAVNAGAALDTAGRTPPAGIASAVGGARNSPTAGSAPTTGDIDLARGDDMDGSNGTDRVDASDPARDELASDTPAADGTTPGEGTVALASPATARGRDSRPPRARAGSRAAAQKPARDGDGTRLPPAAPGDAEPPQGSSPPPPKPKKAGEHSIEQLLAEASGGAGAGSPAPGASAPAKPAAAPVPDKAELDRDDIKKAMDAIQGQVSACKDKLAEPGMVTIAVRLKVASSGQVTSASASGKHAGTPVGECVAKAVRSARFPAISGPPSSLSYSFLLSQ